MTLGEFWSKFKNAFHINLLTSRCFPQGTLLIVMILDNALEAVFV